MKSILRLLFITTIWTAFANQAIAECSLTPEQVRRDDVLIVVNDNSIASKGTVSVKGVGDYYCERRGINPANVAHVRVPVTDDVPLDQFISLRDQLIKHMQENTLPNGVVPVACDTSKGYTRYYCPESVNQLTQKSKIRYLVMTKGLPIRFTFTGSLLSGNLEASVDNYLRYWLSNYFSKDIAFTLNFNDRNDRAIDFGDGRGMRSVNPKIDRELIVGRIDGVDAESAKRLVDRAISAEKNGIYGKLYGNKFGGDFIRKSLEEGAFWKEWRIPTPDNSSNTNIIYLTWRYLHGLFGELRGIEGGPAVRHTMNAQCISVDALGIIPKECVTAINRGAISDGLPRDVNQAPGTPSGRIPSPDNALVHHDVGGSFSSLPTFDFLLNWRDNDSCNTLCGENDAVCKAASTDAYKEIDTRCVRVAEGYMGYTYGSYHAGIMNSWPTGWFQSVNNHPNQFANTGSSPYYLWSPDVRDDEGFDDNFSLWYRNTDEIPSSTCYSDTDLETYQSSPLDHCKQEKRVNINSVIEIEERAINQANPQKVTIRFKYRGLGLSRDLPIYARIMVRESTNTTNQVVYPVSWIKTLAGPNDPADGVSWGDATVTFTLDPSLHQHPQLLYNAIKIRTFSIDRFEGELAFDSFSIDEDGVDIPMINPSFSNGHRQLSGGDSAATFLSRVNGAAFWGNISHHESTGNSFERNPFEVIIYFLRGLPLGDAVWFGEFHNSGIFYGDPIYSPIAIHLDYLSAADNRAPDDYFNIVDDSPLELTGDTLNGSGADVTTTYRVDYCTGNDFFLCDQDSDNRWLPVTGTGLPDPTGGQRNMSLGNWDISGLAEGEYVIRLAATSTNSTKGLTQTFYDYYTVTMYSPVTANDFDEDGLSYQEEIAAGTNPWNDDTDNDGLPDQWEVSFGVDALTKSTNADSDGDGVTDSVEFIRGTDPSRGIDPPDDMLTPVVSTIEVDPVKGMDDGQSPFETLSAAITSAQAGDTISLLPGKHFENFVTFKFPLYLQGSPDHSAILKVVNFISQAGGVVTVSDLTIKLPDMRINSNTDLSQWRFERNNISTNIRTNSGSSVEFINNLFAGASSDAINILGGSSVVLRNNTLTGNDVGVRADTDSSVKIIDSIIFGNTAADLIGVRQDDISYSLIGDVLLTGVNGNIDGDPRFVDPVNKDYHLQIDSPAIDAGDPKSDFSQEPPSNICGINMGAYGNTDEAQTALSLNDAATGNVVITGTVSEGSTLTAVTDSICDADGLGVLSYAWKSSGVSVGSNSSTYTLVQSDVANTLTVTVSYTDGGGASESFTSTATIQVAGGGNAEKSSSSGRIDWLLLLWLSLYGLWRIRSKQQYM